MERHLATTERILAEGEAVDEPVRAHAGDGR